MPSVDYPNLAGKVKLLGSRGEFAPDLQND
jgi:hypothetical protein